MMTASAMCYVRSAVVWCQRNDSIVGSMLALYMHLQRMEPRFGSIRQYVKGNAPATHVV